MDIEKKDALKNIMRGLFVSKHQGDVVSSISLRDVSTLFRKSHEYEKPVVEEVTGVSRNNVQSRYSKIGKSKRLEKIANDILKTLLDIRTFENNKREYEDALRNYHSIVEARRHKEIMEVFQKEIQNGKISISAAKQKKSNKTLLLGGLALGAVAFMLPLKSFAKEIEDELNEKDSNKQLDDLEKELDKSVLEKELLDLQKQFSEFDELPDEIPEEESVDEELKLDNDIEKATSEIEKIQTDIDKLEIEAKEETGVSRTDTTSATGTSTAGSAIGISTATNIAAAPLPSNEKNEYGTATAGSAIGISTATNRQVTATTEIGSTQAVSRNRVGFARLRAEESAVMEVTPDVRFGGFPYKPNLVEEKPTVTRVSSLESIDELPSIDGSPNAIDKLMVKIGASEGGTLGYDAINIPVVKGQIKDKETNQMKTKDFNAEELKQIKAQMWTESKIVKGNIDVTTGKKFEKNLSEMTMQEVIDLGKRRLEYYASFKFNGKPVDLAVATAAGRFGFTMATIQDYASKLFGVNWKKETFSKENQEKMTRLLLKSNVILFEEKKLPISEAFLYMKHFFGTNSEKPLQIVNAKDTDKMSDIMSDAEKKSNPTQAAMTVKEFKDKLIKQGFSFDPIDTKKLITEEDRKVINPKSQTSQTRATVVAVQRNTGERVISSSTQNTDAKKQSKTKPVIIVQNNNNTVINNRNSVNNVSAPRQQNNNPNMRQ